MKMDTRTKIVPMEEAARIAAEGATVVSGYFDPLLASHAERLTGLKRSGVPLVVIVADPENPILPAQARMELVAGLAVVDHVAAVDQVAVVDHVDEPPDRLKATVHMEEEDTRTLEALIQHVHLRQRASS
jgi:glycerol-3-phosphate cytidylyltransferase-like family protein